MSNPFVYTDLVQALDDLKIFSSMNMNEHKVLFLACIPGGMTITKQQPNDAGHIAAIAINGKIFEAR